MSRPLVVPGMAMDGAGNLFVVDRGGNTVRKIIPDGVVSTLAGADGARGSADGVGSAARFDGPADVAVDGAGNLFVTDSLNHTIRKITPAGAVTTLAGKAGSNGATDGAGAEARFNAPQSIAIDDAGNLVVSDGGNFTIRRITPAGVVTTVAGGAGISGRADGTGSAARFASPLGLTLDGAGNAFVADGENNAIRRITPAGVVTTVVGVLSSSSLGATSGPLPGSLAHPTAVAFNANGHLIITIDKAVLLASW